ncbi:MAG: polyprenyl synthetase family protein [Geminicoccaceae bacterium]
MVAVDRIERALEKALSCATDDLCPPRFAASLRHAVMPGGARVRPRLCLAVANACGDDRPSLTDGAAAAIELLHCASLVHDDLPCFDDADVRRGKPSVHMAFGEPIAVLAGDALIVLAFQVMADEILSAPERSARLLAIVAKAVGAPRGIVAGQAWESEPMTVLEIYQRAKTGSLFVAAAAAGAAAAGADPAPWEDFGEHLGEAYQVADDLRDAIAEPDELGKPVGQDEAFNRPNAVAELGIGGAIGRLEGLIADAIGHIPQCENAQALKDLIRIEVKRLMPKKAARYAA